jgi:hypothetical protein
MGWVILLLFVLPVLFIVIVIAAISIAGANTYRTAKRAWSELKPYVTAIQENVTRAQQRGNEFSARGQALSDTFKEIQGRLAFVGGEVRETQDNPMIRMADFAGRMGSRKS